MMKDEVGSYYQDILNAIPLMVFVVDFDVRVHDLNRAAQVLFGDRNAVLRRRGGEVMHCLHSLDVPEGCGRGPYCPDCTIRNSVTASIHGKAVMRKRTHMTLDLSNVRTDFELLVTTSPLPMDGEPRALLILEDISEVAVLRGLIPICMKCKGVRNDQDYWQSIEEYFNHHTGVEFSHGICPKCLQEHYPEYADDPNAEAPPTQSA